MPADPVIVGENSHFTLGFLVIWATIVAYVAFIDFQGRANAKAIEGLQKDSEAIQAIQLDMAVIKSEMRNLTEEVKRFNQGGKRK